MSVAATGGYGRSGSMSYPGFGAGGGRNIDMARFAHLEDAKKKERMH